MSNMSYCRFQNTLEDLEDCRDAMQGVDQYYQKLDDLSKAEQSAMRSLARVCKEISDMYKSGDHVFAENDFVPDED